MVHNCGTDCPDSMFSLAMMTMVDPLTEYCRMLSDALTVDIGYVSVDFFADFWRMVTPSVQVSESVHRMADWNVTNTVVEVRMASL